MNEVTLRWPSKDLSPNARGHWSKKARAAKSYRLDCWAKAIEAKLCVNWDGPIHVWLTFYPPDRRHRDQDNMIASLKSGMDGLSDALSINDKHFHLHHQVADDIGGMVKVRISATGET